MNRIISLVSDAYGGRGGGAVYVRNLLQAICSHSGVGEMIALPRAIAYELEPLPPKLRFEAWAAGSKLRFAKAVLGLTCRMDRCALILCGHLRLLPFAHVLGMRFRCPVLPVVYGIDAWRPTPHASVNYLCRRIERFISIRMMTSDRFRQWARIPHAKCYYLPNCIDLNAFSFAPKRADLVSRFRLAGRTVVMTAGRMDPSEKFKGFDEVIETLPDLAKEVPNVVYLIMGDGDDKARLEEKAKALGVADRLLFTGYVSESEKADYYQLSDVVAMPGRGEIYDTYPYRFAFLEPLACGIPVVGSELETEAERNDPDVRELLVQVNPHDCRDIKRGILEALKRGRGISPALSKFSYDVFERKTHQMLDEVLSCNRTGWPRGDIHG